MDRTPPPENNDIVVIGSSAGGIEALSVLVGTLPSDFPAPLVLAQHLDPSRPSELASILERTSNLPIVSISNSTPLEPGKVYVIPANRHVIIRDDHVELEGNYVDHPRPSIDLLLSSAAGVYGERLIAVILTGSGSDGAAGAVDVKRAGGVIITQNPQTARYPSMPLSLIPADVDYRVDLEQIGPLLYDLLKRVRIPPTDAQNDLKDILSRISRSANIDFRSYKPSTILRRITRRMIVTHCATIQDYDYYLEQHPEEIGELVMAFLIKVTEFFRDSEAFEFLKANVLPQLIEYGRTQGRVLRFWSAGCATGEEPYSLAILLAELLGRELPDWSIKIFATDLDEAAITFARRGLYSGNMLQNLSDTQRLRFFEPTEQGFRISKTLRQMVIFGQQDLGHGAPFPQINLVVCRNLLIYFKPELQQQILDLFAYSLFHVGGYLFLGKAETVRSSKATFELINKRWKIYRCTSAPFLLPSRYLIPRQRVLDRGSLAQPVTIVEQQSEQAQLTTQFEINQLRRFNEIILRHLPLGVVLIDRSYRIISISGTARRLLHIRDQGGNQDFLHTARSLPYEDVRSAIDIVFQEHTVQILSEIDLHTSMSDDIHYVSLTISPAQLGANMPDLVMISVSDATAQVETRQRLEIAQTEQAQLVKELTIANKRLNEMNRELLEANEELQATNEEMMLTQEELQATNEEFEATNEELQSTNEELETNNEELQATNEELETTNEELNARTSELQALAGVIESERVRLSEIIELAPIYIMVLRGENLIVEAFNPRYAQLLAGCEAMGHPLEAVFELFWDGKTAAEIIELAREVYQHNVSRATPRIRTALLARHGVSAEAYFVYTLVPSHDTAGNVTGVLIYAEDETEQRFKEAEESRRKLSLIFEHAYQVSLALYDVPTAQLLTASPRYCDVLESVRGIARTDATGRCWQELCPFVDGEEADDIWNSVLESRIPARRPEVRRTIKGDEKETIWDWSLTPLMDDERPDITRFMLASAIEITDQVRAREEVERLDHLKDEFLSLASHELRTPLTPLMGYADMLNQMVARLESERGPDWEQRMGRFVDTFSKQIDRLRMLVEDLLDVSRLQSGRFTFHNERVDLVALIQQVADEAQMLSDKHTIRAQIPDDGELVVSGDPVRLAQVMLNLLQNAIIHAPTSLQIDLRLSQIPASAAAPAEADDPESNSPLAQIEVQDYGQGIAPEDLGALFTRFYQVSRNDRPIQGGLGLGLFISKQIVVQHGGTIAVDSQIGGGTTFTVRLPLASD